MAVVNPTKRFDALQRIALWLLVLLAIKGLISILYQYRFYFPADFQGSTFLSTRRSTFSGVYKTAFYLHIATGPCNIILGFLLMFSGFRKCFGKHHRMLGKLQVFLIVTLLTPTGLIMSTQAFSGPIAGVGFAALSIATAWTAIAAAHFASRGQFITHELWATRCFLLLCSPLLLRLSSGASYVAGIESETTYMISAWTSWLLPIIVFEVYQRRRT